MAHAVLNLCGPGSRRQKTWQQVLRLSLLEHTSLGNTCCSFAPGQAHQAQQASQSSCSMQTTCLLPSLSFAGALLWLLGSFLATLLSLLAFRGSRSRDCSVALLLCSRRRSASQVRTAHAMWDHWCSSNGWVLLGCCGVWQLRWSTAVMTALSFSCGTAVDPRPTTSEDPSGL